MSGYVLIGVGIAMLAIAIVLIISSIVYRITSGKKIRNELKNEYDI